MTVVETFTIFFKIFHHHLQPLAHCLASNYSAWARLKIKDTWRTGNATSLGLSTLLQTKLTVSLPWLRLEFLGGKSRRPEEAEKKSLGHVRNGILINSHRTSTKWSDCQWNTWKATGLSVWKTICSLTYVDLVYKASCIPSDSPPVTALWVLLHYTKLVFLHPSYAALTKTCSDHLYVLSWFYRHTIRANE